MCRSFMCGKFLQIRRETGQLKKYSEEHGKNVTCPLGLSYHISISTTYLKMGLSFFHCFVIPNLDAWKLNVS